METASTTEGKVRFELEQVFDRYVRRGLLEPDLPEDFYNLPCTGNNAFIFKECLSELENESNDELRIGLAYLVPLFIPSYKPPAASPQLEDGYTTIANEILEAMAKTPFSGKEIQIVCVVFRKTYGWHKKNAPMSIGGFQKDTGLDRRSVTRTLSRLTQRRILIKTSNGFISTYGFQKDYTKWKGRGKKTPVGAKRPLPPKIGVKRPLKIGAKLPPHKIYKDKKYYVEGSDELRLASFLLEEIRKNQPSFKEPNLQAWAKEIDLMVRRDGRTPERIEGVIRWCQGDAFWWKNILSVSKLRKQFDRLEAEMASPKGKVKEMPRVEYKDLTGGGRP